MYWKKKKQLRTYTMLLISDNPVPEYKEGCISMDYNWLHSLFTIRKVKFRYTICSTGRCSGANKRVKVTK